MQATQSALTSAPGSPRTCRGVPAIGGPLLDCGAPLSATAFFRCEACSDEIDQRNERARTADEDNGRRRMLTAAGLSRPFVDGRKTLDTVRATTPQHSDAITAARRWAEATSADGNRLGVLLRGDPGVGKSDIAEGAIRAAVMRGKPAKYVNARSLILRLQTAFRDDSPETADQILKCYTSAETALFLALDDLGATKMTRFAADNLYTIFERRARNEMPTLCATNYGSMSELAARLKPSDGDELDAIRPTDRIEELCPNVVTLRGESLRATISGGPNAYQLSGA